MDAQEIRHASFRPAEAGGIRYWDGHKERFSPNRYSSQETGASYTLAVGGVRQSEFGAWGCYSARHQGTAKIRVHPLRAADGLQLASALAAAEENPSSMGFMCFDARLNQAASREGFTILPP